MINGSIANPVELVIYLSAYMATLFAIINKCFTLIHVVPSGVMRWVGGQGAQYGGEAEGVQAMKGGAEAGAGGAKSFAGGAKQASGESGDKIGKLGDDIAAGVNDYKKVKDLAFLGKRKGIRIENQGTLLSYVRR